MGFLIILVYIALALLSPWAGYPALADLRIMLWLMFIIAFVTLFQIMFRKISLWVPQTPLLGIFLFLTVLSVAVTGWFGGATIAFFLVMVPLTACLALIGNVSSLSRIRWLSLTLVLVGTYLSIRGILAVEFDIDRETYAFAERIYSDDETEVIAEIYRARALSFLKDPNDLAQYLVACLPLAVFLWRRGRVIGNVFLVVAPICLMGGALYLTRSRGGLVGLAFLITLAAFRRSKFVAPLAGIGVVAGALALGFSGGRSVSISAGTGAGRIDLWADAIRLAGAHPIFGVGYGNIRDHLESFTAHNSYLLCLAETGVPGLFFWLAAFSLTFLQLWPVFSDAGISEDTRRCCRFVAGSLASAMVTSFFLSRTYALTLYIFLGTAVSAFLVARKEQAEPAPIFRSQWLLWNGLAMFLLVGVFYGMVRLRWLLE
jgi:O-antigen ligase